VSQTAAKIDWAALFARARARWFVLIFVAALGWLDIVIHRDLLTLVLILGVGALVIFVTDLFKTFDKGGEAAKLWAQVPKQARPFVLAAPFLLYYLLRGRGTGLQSGVVGMLTSLIMIAVLSYTAKAVDERVIVFYRVRDRVPAWIRIVLLQVVAILIGFAIVHGALSDLPALFGGKTLHPKNPTALQAPFIFAGFLSTTLGWFLFHKPEP
jgi:hypothetical protein